MRVLRRIICQCFVIALLAVLVVPVAGASESTKLVSISGKVKAIDTLKGVLVVGPVTLVTDANTRFYLTKNSTGNDHFDQLRAGYTVRCSYLKGGAAPYLLESLHLISKYSTYKLPEL